MQTPLDTASELPRRANAPSNGGGGDSSADGGGGEGDGIGGGDGDGGGGDRSGEGGDGHARPVHTYPLLYMHPLLLQLLSHSTSPRVVHAAAVSSNVIGTNEDCPSTPAMQSLLEGEVRRLQSPDEVQH